MGDSNRRPPHIPSASRFGQRIHTPQPPAACTHAPLPAPTPSALPRPPGGASAHDSARRTRRPGSPATKHARHGWGARVRECLQWHTHTPHGIWDGIHVHPRPRQCGTTSPSISGYPTLRILCLTSFNSVSVSFRESSRFLERLRQTGILPLN